jgi:hypothetical protein
LEFLANPVCLEWVRCEKKFREEPRKVANEPLGRVDQVESALQSNVQNGIVVRIGTPVFRREPTNGSLLGSVRCESSTSIET